MVLVAVGDLCFSCLPDDRDDPFGDSRSTGTPFFALYPDWHAHVYDHPHVYDFPRTERKRELLRRWHEQYGLLRVFGRVRRVWKVWRRSTRVDPVGRRQRARAAYCQVERMAGN